MQKLLGMNHHPMHPRRLKHVADVDGFPPGLQAPVFSVPVGEGLAIALYGPHRSGADLNADERELLVRFADAAAGRLAAKLGREAAHRLVEHAAAQVRQSGASLAEVLAENQTAREAEVDLTSAFDLSPSVTAAARWVDPALRHAAAIRARLTLQHYLER